MTSTSPRPNRLARLPRWISHWLGYRAGPVPKQPDYIIWIWSFIGAFGGLSVLQAIFGHSHYFLQRDVPSIIASYGASAVLCYGAIEAPLAQPRALMGGHFISALTGVCITKLFGLLPTEQRLDQLRWLAGSLSSATAIVLMQMTTTTHPPAGATALLAAVSPEVYVMGWYYLPVVLLSSTLVLISALLVNNVQRRYPVFWFTPTPPAVAPPVPKSEPPPALADRDDGDLEKGVIGTPASSD
ncbi:HPP family-domain-containing protein [Lentinula guzmanii]|uniref:HPP family-domain-containing protein n=2 Tax=Lentinula TaxID=5352 RepID=A0AA38JI06_9AGAR|nr:HPP family-domain-containing protein [Lentinula guzmanii]KAJ3785925.1 HPP family-domain-containing protein [Lentinula aff. detonsa]KAJ3798441.1 HPP family-domain-containing protein [Lentinula aff. detonsa]